MAPRRSTKPPADSQAQGHFLTVLFLAVRMLVDRPLRLEELARRIGVSRRSAYRLLHGLEAAGLKLEVATDGREVRYRLNRLNVIGALGLNPKPGPR